MDTKKDIHYLEGSTESQEKNNNKEEILTSQKNGLLKFFAYIFTLQKLETVLNLIFGLITTI